MDAATLTFVPRLIVIPNRIRERYILLMGLRYHDWRPMLLRYPDVFVCPAGSVWFCSDSEYLLVCR